MKLIPDLVQSGKSDFPSWQRQPVADNIAKAKTPPAQYQNTHRLDGSNAENTQSTPTRKLQTMLACAEASRAVVV